MKKTLIGLTALAVAIPAMVATPASAQRHHRDSYQQDYRQDYRGYDNRSDNRGYDNRRDYDRNGYYNGRSWRDNRGQYRCRRSDGSTGLLIGAVGGALVGRTIDTRGDRTVGTLLGAVVGGLIGNSVEKDNNRGRYRCR